MSQFTCNRGGEGDLLAVVRGGCSSSIMENNPYPPACFAPFTTQQQEDHDDFDFSAFPGLFETTSTVLDDQLEDLYKPFYPILNPLSSPSSSATCVELERVPQKVQKKETLTGSPAALEVKYKRRKSQHKRVVLQVTADAISSDKWAWRKYGQKPIKGSPHPRSYYRCSSTKGCLARKQVERSKSDPDMFVITYTAEHCHTQPTRRNSLAGTPRNKFSTPKTTATSGASGPNTPPTAALSPLAPSLATIEDELSQQGIIKKLESTEELEHNQLVICDMILCDDFLMDFDELDRLTSDLAYDGDLLQQPFPCTI